MISLTVGKMMVQLVGTIGYKLSAAYWLCVECVFTYLRCNAEGCKVAM